MAGASESRTAVLGDLVVADADGVVVWPAASYDEYLAPADAKRRQDESLVR